MANGQEKIQSNVNITSPVDYSWVKPGETINIKWDDHPNSTDYYVTIKYPNPNGEFLSTDEKYINNKTEYSWKVPCETPYSICGNLGYLTDYSIVIMVRPQHRTESGHAGSITLKCVDTDLDVPAFTESPVHFICGNQFTPKVELDEARDNGLSCWRDDIQGLSREYLNENRAVKWYWSLEDQDQGTNVKSTSRVYDGGVPNTADKQLYFTTLNYDENCPNRYKPVAGLAIVNPIEIPDFTPYPFINSFRDLNGNYSINSTEEFICVDDEFKCQVPTTYLDLPYEVNIKTIIPNFPFDGTVKFQYCAIAEDGETMQSIDNIHGAEKVLVNQSLDRYFRICETDINADAKFRNFSWTSEVILEDSKTNLGPSCSSNREFGVFLLNTLAIPDFPVIVSPADICALAKFLVGQALPDLTSNVGCGLEDWDKNLILKPSNFDLTEFKIDDKTYLSPVGYLIPNLTMAGLKDINAFFNIFWNFKWYNSNGDIIESELFIEKNKIRPSENSIRFVTSNKESSVVAEKSFTLAKSGLQIFPNPSRGNLTITGANDSRIDKISIYSLSGVVISEVFKPVFPFKMEVHNLPSSVYTIETIFENGERVSNMFIKN
ncbi:MAG: hypothetical protein ACI9WO_001828 [Sphingobacteriales bacterium]|jgi:hypothetical protein